MKGLLTGTDSQGTYGGANGGTRAEACVMVVRMVEQDKRAEVEVEVNQGGNSGGSSVVVEQPSASEVQFNSQGQMVVD